MYSRTLIRDILQSSSDFEGKEVTVAGWVRSVRRSKQCSFIVLNDGSCQGNLQVVVDPATPDYENISKVLTGTSMKAVGTLVASLGKGQSIEMQSGKAAIIGAATNDYPLQKKATGLEFLRENAHLRVRSNLFGAIFRLRHKLAMATHRFFDERGFYYLHSPILTAVDAEGAGQMFKVADSEKYFGRESSLCVSGQLEAECFAMGLNAVYTFGPTFRAENSNTPRHLAEFWMVEPEAAFMDLEENADLAEDYLKALISCVLEQSSEEMEAIGNYHRFAAKGTGEKVSDLTALLEGVRTSTFERISYTEAIKLCQQSSTKFEFGTTWGIDLQTEHERYISEKVVGGPVIITDYPKDIKAFYMKQNDDGKTVRAMDVLVPGVGEIIGGSQREEDLEKLQSRMKEMEMDTEPLWWYLDLRKFGTVPHSGFGLGLERLLRYITGMKNIRDVTPFPRTPGSCDF